MARKIFKVESVELTLEEAKHLGRLFKALNLSKQKIDEMNEDIEARIIFDIEDAVKWLEGA